MINIQHKGHSQRAAHKAIFREREMGDCVMFAWLTGEEAIMSNI